MYFFAILLQLQNVLTKSWLSLVGAPFLMEIIKMAFTTLTKTQNAFLEEYLRGTGRTLTAAQAEALFGIRNIRARMTELRQAGLKVSRVPTTVGRSAYKVSARDVHGSRARALV
ncbi:MAG: helix-turn-helix domain-containing protein [Fischerella sp.]|nr:helix-turn-helix domain-containing protein [Fischerella sp.]